MDGYDSTVQILDQFKRRNPTGVNQNGHTVHVVAVTAFVNDENIKKCFSVGISEVINKPLSNDSL